MAAFDELDPTQYTEVVEEQTHPNAHPNRQAQNDANSNVSLNRWAAAYAQDQANELYRRGIVVFNDDVKDMAKEALKEAQKVQDDVRMENLRKQNQLAESIAEKEYEAKRTGLPLTDKQREDAAHIANSQDVIFNLNQMHKDALKTGVYGKWLIGGATKNFYDATDSRVRAYEAALTGASTQIARGYLGEGATQAGEQSTRTMLKDMMGGSGDDEASSAVKTLTLVKGTLDNQANQIRSLRSRYDVSDLQDQYIRAYNKYRPMLEQFGEESQRKNPAASPEELFGGKEAQAKLIAKGPAPILPASTKAGTSESTDDRLSAATMPQALVGRVPELPSTDVWNQAAQTADKRLQELYAQQAPMVGQTPQLGDISQWQEIGKLDPEVQQRMAQEREERMRTGKSTVGRAVTGAVQQVAVGPTPISPQQVGQGIGGVFNWLGGLLPENWPGNRALPQQNLNALRFPP
jgi:hypothetical protein